MPREPILRDWTAAEHRYLERRQMEETNRNARSLIESGERQERLAKAQIRAQEQGNRIAAQQLAVERERLAAEYEHQKAQTALQTEQVNLQRVALERQTAHNFAMWRQTPDGQRFVTWAIGALSVLEVLDARDRDWRGAWKNWRDQAVSADDIYVHEFASLSGAPASPSSTKSMLIGTASVGVVAVILLMCGGLSFLADQSTMGTLMLLAAVLAIAGAFAIPGFSFWSRHQAKEQARAIVSSARERSAARAQRFGFDPLQFSDPPEWWSDDDVEALRTSIVAVIDQGRNACAFGGYAPVTVPSVLSPNIGGRRAITAAPPLRDLLAAWQREN